MMIEEIKICTMNTVQNLISQIEISSESEMADFIYDVPFRKHANAYLGKKKIFEVTTAYTQVLLLSGIWETLCLRLMGQVKTYFIFGRLVLIKRT